MKNATALTLLRSEDSDWFNFELVHSSLITFRVNNEVKSYGFIIPNSIIGEKKSVELLNQISDRLRTPLHKFKVKVIGDKKPIESFVVLLRQEKINFEEIILKTVQCPLEILYSPAENKVKVAKKEDAPQAKNEKYKVLIVDDSPTIRTLFERILKSDPDIEVVGSIENPTKVLEFLDKNEVDVITLDIQMPEMNGVELLQRFLPKHKIPTIMISALGIEDGPLVFAALETGAIDYIQKPSLNEIDHVSKVMIEKIKSAKNAKVMFKQGAKVLPVSNLTVTKKKTPPTTHNGPIDQLIAIGSSTGGTEALREVLTFLPSEIPPVLIVQHIPAVFSKAFADRMNQLVPFYVTEAVDGMEVVPNQVIIAAGATQMSVVKRGEKLFVKVDPNAEPMNRHKPSVDHLFLSMHDCKLGEKTIGVILTGMGADGAKGLKALHDQGARTIGQDEATSIVYGMPQAAFQCGAVDRQLPITSIANGIIDLWKRPKVAIKKRA